MSKKQERLGKGGKRPITSFDDALKFLLFIPDVFSRGLWNLAKLSKQQDKISNFVIDFVSPILSFAFNNLYQLKVNGTENIPPNSGAIFAVNHGSWLDAQVLAVALPDKPYFMAKKELLEMPLSGLFMEVCKAISIDREHTDIIGLKKAISLLRNKKRIVIFPEGTIPGEEELSRSDVEKDTQLLPGNEGAVILAAKTNTPIIPVGIINSDKNLPPEVFPLMKELPPKQFYPITVNIGKPIYFNTKKGEKLDKETVKEQTKKVMISIAKLALKI